MLNRFMTKTSVKETLSDLWEEARFRLQKPKPVTIRFPGSGNVRLLFHFSPHATAQDANGLDPVMKEFKPHVLCIEEGLAYEEEAQRVEAFFSARNKYAKYDDEYEEALHQVIRKHKPRVFVLERFPLEESLELTKLHPSLVKAADAFFKGKPEQALSEAREALEKYAAQTRRREEHIAKKLTNIRELLVARFPELSKEKELRVVVKYGTAHTSLYAHATKQGMTAGRAISTPYYFPTFQALVRKYIFEKEAKANNEELARALVGDVISARLRKIGVGGSNRAAFANLVVRNLSIEQFRNISDAIRRSNKKLSTAIEDSLTEHGIPIPITKYGVHKFLRQRGIPLSHE